MCPVPCTMKTQRNHGHPVRRTLAATALAVASAAAASSEASDNEASIAGIWRMDVRTLMADATVFFVLDTDRTCKQVVRIDLLGFSKWTARTCTWRLDGEQLTLALQESAAPKSELETTAQVRLAEVTPDRLVISSEGETQLWARASELPPDFQVQLQAVSAR